MKVRVGDLVSPKNGRRVHWIGLVLEQRHTTAFEDDIEEAKDCLVQWARDPNRTAWWVDWSLEVVSESR